MHIAQSVCSGILLCPWIGQNAVPFGLAIVLIDVDHLLEYYLDTKNLNPRGFFVYHAIVVKNLDKGYLGLNIFHTIECYILLLILAGWFPIFYYVVFGFFTHHVLDQIFLIRLKHPFARALSVVEYCVRRKKHPVSLREIVKSGEVNIEGILDADRWLSKWKM